LYKFDISGLKCQVPLRPDKARYSAGRTCMQAMDIKHWRVNGRDTPTPMTAKAGARPPHSPTSHLNPSQFWSLKPQLASTSQLNLSRFCHSITQPSPRKVLTTK